MPRVAAGDLLHQHGGLDATVEERDADMGAGAVFHDNRVELEPLSAPGESPARPEPARAGSRTGLAA